MSGTDRDGRITRFIQVNRDIDPECNNRLNLTAPALAAPGSYAINAVKLSNATAAQ